MFSYCIQERSNNCGSLTVPGDPLLVFIVCSLQSVISKKNFLSSGYYQEWEEKIIRDYYRSAGAEFCRQLMPHRTIHSIRHKAEKLGIKHRNCTPWMDEEIAIVRQGILENKTVENIWYLLNENGFPRPYFGVKDKYREVRKTLRQDSQG